MSDRRENSILSTMSHDEASARPRGIIAILYDACGCSRAWHGYLPNMSPHKSGGPDCLRGRSARSFVVVAIISTSISTFPKRRTGSAAGFANSLPERGLQRLSVVFVTVLAIHSPSLASKLIRTGTAFPHNSVSLTIGLSDFET